MKIKTQTYIEWMIGGSFVSSTDAVPVNDRSIPYDFPQMAFGFRFHDVTEAELEDGEILTGKPKNISPRYLRGEVHTLEDVEREGKSLVLVENMKCNNWSRVIKCLQGYIPLYEGDVVIQQGVE